MSLNYELNLDFFYKKLYFKISFSLKSISFYQYRFNLIINSKAKIVKTGS